MWEVRRGNTDDLSWYHVLSFLFRSLSNSLFFLLPKVKSLSFFSLNITSGPEQQWMCSNLSRMNQSLEGEFTLFHEHQTLRLKDKEANINAVRHLLDAGWHYTKTDFKTHYVTDPRPPFAHLDFLTFLSADPLKLCQAEAVGCFSTLDQVLRHLSYRGPSPLIAQFALGRVVVAPKFLNLIITEAASLSVTFNAAELLFFL